MSKDVISLYIRKHCFLLISIALFGMYYHEGYKMPASATVFPRIILYVVVPVVVWNLIASFIEIKQEVAARQEGGKEESTRDAGFVKRMIGLALTLAYIFCMSRLGFFTSTTLYLLAFVSLLGVRSIVRLAIYTLSIDAFIYILFVQWLNIQLPVGVLI